jgi:HPr kinase/phosphorylase
MRLVHGTTVDLEGRGVLILGPSGSGKSDLALRLIDGGAVLVADDQTELAAEDGRLVARPPAAIAGLLEVRGVGIARVAYRARTVLTTVVDLVPSDAVERLPGPDFAQFLGISLPLFRLFAFEGSTPAKVRLATLSTTRDIMRPS